MLTWRAIAPLFLILLLDALSFGLILPELGKLFLNDTRLLGTGTPTIVRDILYSVTISLPLFGMLFGAPLLGSLSDSVGRKQTLLFSLLGCALCFLGSAISIVVGSVVLLLLSRLVLGVLNGNESIAQAAIADLHNKNTANKAISMSLISLGGSVGFVIGPLLGGYFSDSTLCHWFNYQTPFYVAAVLCLLSAGMLYLFFQETHTPTKTQFRWQQSFESLWFAFTRPEFRYIACMYFCMEFAWGLYFQSISLLLLLGHGFSTHEIGSFMTYIAVCFMFTLLTLIRLLHKRFTSHTVVIIGMLLLGLGGFCTLISPTTGNVLITAFFTTVGVGVTYNTLLALFSNAAHAAHQGHAMGMAVSIGAIAWILAALLSGILSGVNLYLPYILIGVMGMVGVGFAFKAKLNDYAQ